MPFPLSWTLPCCCVENGTVDPRDGEDEEGASLHGCHKELGWILLLIRSSPHCRSPSEQGRLPLLLPKHPKMMQSYFWAMTCPYLVLPHLELPQQAGQSETPMCRSTFRSQWLREDSAARSAPERHLHDPICLTSPASFRGNSECRKLRLPLGDPALESNLKSSLSLGGRSKVRRKLASTPALPHEGGGEPALCGGSLPPCCPLRLRHFAFLPSREARLASPVFSQVSSRIFPFLN